MDYKDLIDRLNNAAGGPDGVAMCRDAATAITDLLSRAEAAEADRDRLREALKPNCLLCDSMHENGNCTEVGGFCTAVPAAHCPLIPKLRDRVKAAEDRAEKAEHDMKRIVNRSSYPCEYCTKEKCFATDMKRQCYDFVWDGGQKEE